MSKDYRKPFLLSIWKNEKHQMEQSFLIAKERRSPDRRFIQRALWKLRKPSRAGRPSLMA
jgi:hypothetical protein